jgi:endonuclease-3
MEPTQKLLAAHERLCAEYGCPIPYFADHDPLSALVSALLSHRTRNADSRRAFEALRERYATWEDLRDAPTDEVMALVEGCTWPEQKAPRLQAVLRQLTAELGEPLSLEALGERSPEDARAFLERLPGVGPKTSAATIAFSRLRRRALAVDSHHHRVAVRLGILGPTVAVGPAHAILEEMLPADWDAQAVYDDHEVFMLHGQRVCTWRAPACERCVVRDLCDTYAALAGEGVRSSAGSG